MTIRMMWHRYALWCNTRTRAEFALWSLVAAVTGLAGVIGMNAVFGAAGLWAALALAVPVCVAVVVAIWRGSIAVRA